MASNTQQYWRSVRAIAAKLDPEAAELDANEMDGDERKHLEKSEKEIWLVSKAHEETGGVAGKVVSATPWVAALWLKMTTHEPATEPQVSAHKADLARRKEEIERDEADRKGVPTSKLLEALVAAQTAGNAQQRRKGE